MWSLYQRANKFGQSPAAMIGIHHFVLAYNFDEAVHLYGGWIEARRSETTKDGKPVWSMEELLGLPIQTRNISSADLISMGVG
jgi:hypothetical protein